MNEQFNATSDTVYVISEVV